ncbi:Hypothetical protein PP7435_CHR4-0612 [Komagataella phaffii CBS 7435]|uniref:B box-type domain-containing protein n=2 Tax=Komagataella phaffii TaxID=460519 RepID=C4R7Q0_KOMPG|nr:putative type-III integral membrane protein of unknown function [Komagataella phaffii GS115]AOA65130.1 GQ67_04725T0 [Komagataella phaffii]CAH2450993.1 Hypothetical protein BQ9382_C4-3215 [Komagataella phaffii CBS 7435]AOA69848.1 GQ68_04697T0 [Komagataella phaffii GS115]CAY71625.1 Probable type-III integral membrane protein of unknown function [Komagataella phaffii GS115]CCA40772.1 Hypothetical protein PP7435_CHR4-0612 [Komagataella phaffii CBS 7435]
MSNGKRSLAEVLDTEELKVQEQNEENNLESQAENEDEVDSKFCVECSDMPTEIFCVSCSENFCKPCFGMIHRKGKRKNHKREEVLPDSNGDAPQISNMSQDITGRSGLENANGSENDEEDEIVPDSSNPEKENIEKVIMSGIKKNISYIPLRLTHQERQLLRLLEASLHVSEYTDKVDILSHTSKAKRIVSQLKEMCSILAGLVVASDLKLGQELIVEKEFADNAEWYQKVFEIGRRYKIMNPEKMRDTFGKLCYMVMDSKLPQIEEYLEFNLYKPIQTVERYLSSRDDPQVFKMFDDESIIYATAEISPGNRSRYQINRDIKLKERSIEKIASTYSSSKGFTKEEIRQVLYSIGDFNAYTNANRKPILRMITRLSKFENLSNEYSLGIKFGQGGARLSHNHQKQYQYVFQSLQLWSHIMREMIHLWSLADDDLFSPQQYHMQSTGQGLHRVKACPKVSRAMYKILGECERKCNGWVGSQVVHTGDRDVPNALFFLDKYNQVPQILIPIDRCIDELNEAVKDKFIKTHIESQFGSVEKLCDIILTDFFRHAFDGSGADNFYDAGSCIDGRLTSAWNFVQNISKRQYYKFFMMVGCTGFNGTEGW